MTKRLVSCFLICVCIYVGEIRGQTVAYRPLGSWQSQDAINASLVQRYSNLARPIPSDRPVLPGLRSKNLELLQDALLRKHPKSLKQSPALARKHILRLNQIPYGRNVLNGALAEAFFFDRHPEWQYVRSPNAPQHDGTRVRAGLPPENVQIKFHANGNPATYARNMVSDHKAHKFAVPDDHVGPLKDYLRQKAARLTAQGNPAAAKSAYRDYGRVIPIGANSTDIESGRRVAYRETVRASTSVYVSLGAAIALSLGPTAWDAATGNLPANQALYRATRSLSLLGVGVGTELVLANVSNGALRGTMRGNAIVATAIAITEVSWLLYEHGWSQAFYQPSFYEEVAGGVSSIAAGTLAGLYVAGLTSESGPIVAGVAGLATGVVVGTAAYIGGRAAAHTVLEIFTPEMLQQQERQRISHVKSRFNQNVTALQDYHRLPLFSGFAR